MPKQEHSDTESITQRLRVVLEEYSTHLTKAIEEGNSRFLEMHVTARQVFEQQQSVINELLDLLDDGEEIVA